MIKLGKIISLSGIDGAGKSTQVKLLNRYLTAKNKKILVTEEMFTYTFLKPLITFLRKKTGSPKGGPVKINNSLLPKTWFLLAYIDIWLSYFFVIIPKLKKYKYIIADRFYIDIWANLLYYGYLPKFAFNLINFLPKADIYFILKVKPGVVRKREEDFPISYYLKQSSIYSKIPKILKNIHVIDSNQNPKNVFAQIKKILDTSLVS